MANFGSYGNGLTLKALLENPDLQNPPVVNNADKDKKDGDVLYDSGLAFLGPNLWDKTYSTDDFSLEYMDLDEFLGENGIPVNLDNVIGTDLSSPALSPNNEESDAENSVNLVQSPPVSPPKQTPKHADDLKLPISPAPSSASTSPAASLSPPVVSPSKVVASTHHSSRAGSPNVEFVISKEDIALVSAEGQDSFDPRCRAFSEEELKPQPMIKKSRKVFVPDDAKDDKYWQRRKKNNYAAKRSRDARRIKENQIAMRASFLEKENDALRMELEKVKKENSKLKTSLAKYEPTDGV